MAKYNVTTYEKSLIALYPEVAAEWHPTKNGNILPDNVSAMINKKVWWLGNSCGHEWEAIVNNRTIRKDGCGVCSNYYVVPGINDLSTTRPDLAVEWHHSLNITLDIKTITAGSNKKVWWQCKLGHEWATAISMRHLQNTGCPFCKNKKVWQGFNDLATTHPDLAKEWHPTKNGNFLPTQITAGSDKTAWWQCAKGHEWNVVIGTRKKNSCPFCSNKQVLIGFNDLATTHPQIAKEWHPTKNGNIIPNHITAGSDKKTWWLASCGHTWETSTYRRTSPSSPTGCPQCPASRSNAEQELADFIVDAGFTIEQSIRRIVKPLELDIYIESIHTAIEFNGTYWHTDKRRNKDYHFKKWLACKNKGVTLFQVWEDDWKRNPTLVKRLLLDALKPDVNKPLHAEALTVNVVNAIKARGLYGTHSLDEFPAGSVFYVLHDDRSGVIHAVMAVTVEGEVLHVGGYCDDGTVAGGFTNLVEHISRVSRSKRVSMLVRNDAPAYRLMLSEGFTEAGQVEPGFTYCVGDVRTHESVLTVEFFKIHPKLKHENGFNLGELIQLNKIARIWDAGQTEWVKEVRE